MSRITFDNKSHKRARRAAIRAKESTRFDWTRSETKPRKRSTARRSPHSYSAIPPLAQFLGALFIGLCLSAYPIMMSPVFAHGGGSGHSGTAHHSGAHTSHHGSAGGSARGSFRSYWAD